MRALALVCLLCGCVSDEERAELRRLDAWLSVLDRARAGVVDEDSGIPFVCADYRAKAARFARLRGAAERARRFADACAHDAPVAWVAADLARHADTPPLCDLDGAALAAMPAAELAREPALVADVLRRCCLVRARPFCDRLTAGSPARPSTPR